MAVSYKESAEHLFKLPDKKNKFKNKNSFRVKVLTHPRAFSGPATNSGSVNTLDESTVASKYVFMGRVLDPDMSHHRFLQDPCDISTISSKENAEHAALLTALHTKIILSTKAVKPSFKVGDYIWATAGPGDNNMIYDLQHMQFTAIDDTFPEVYSQMACRDLATLMKGGMDDTVGAGELGITDIPLDPIGVTLHYTNAGTAQDAINTLKKQGNAYHYIIERNGAIVTLAEPNVKVIHDPETNSTHVGVAFSNLGYGSDIPAVAAAMPGKYGSPPIEQWITGPDPRDGTSRKWEPYTTQQISAAVTLLKELKRKYPGITADNIKEHSETARGRKPDGGPALTPHVKEFKRAVA